VKRRTKKKDTYNLISNTTILILIILVLVGLLFLGPWSPFYTPKSLEAGTQTGAENASVIESPWVPLDGCECDISSECDSCSCDPQCETGCPDPVCSPDEMGIAGCPCDVTEKCDPPSSESAE
jgi:hypothetical protein